MTDFITDTWKEDNEIHYKLIFNTTNRDIFDAIQALARRMIDRKTISTNYEYLCTRTPEEMSHILASLTEAFEEKAVQKCAEAGVDITLVSLAHDINAQAQLHWLNKPYQPFQEDIDESNINPNI